MLCETGMTPARKKINYKHYTVLGLTTLSGKPVMCCVIFSGIKETPLYETGLDLKKEIIGDTNMFL